MYIRNQKRHFVFFTNRYCRDWFHKAALRKDACENYVHIARAVLSDVDITLCQIKIKFATLYFKFGLSSFHCHLATGIRGHIINVFAITLLLYSAEGDSIKFRMYSPNSNRHFSNSSFLLSDSEFALVCTHI